MQRMPAGARRHALRAVPVDDRSSVLFPVLQELHQEAEGREGNLLSERLEVLADGLDQRALGVHADGNRDHPAHTIAIARESPLAARRRRRQTRSGNLTEMIIHVSTFLICSVSF